MIVHKLPKTYKHSNRIPLSGWAWLMGFSTLGGVVTGGLMALIATVEYLLIICPVMMGLSSGSCNKIALKQGKVRNPLVALAFGVLSGLITYGTYHYGEYWYARKDWGQQIQIELGEVDGDKSIALVDTFLQEKTGATGFLGYIQYASQQGINLSIGLTSEGTPLKGPLAWLYWLLELAIIEAVIWGLISLTVENPFCEKCNQWFTPIKTIGSVPDEDAEHFINALKQEKVADAGSLIHPTSTEAPNLKISNIEVRTQACPSCHQGDVLIEARHWSVNEKGKFDISQSLRGILSHQEATELTQAISQPPSP